MCMRKPTPVTTRIIRVESGSTRKETSIWNEPLVIQLNTFTSTERAPSGSAIRLKNMDTEMRKETAIERQATNPTAFFPILPPTTPFIMAPMNGSKGISQTCCIILSPHLIKLVDIDGLSSPVYGNEYRKPYRDLGSGDSYIEHHKDRPGNRLQIIRERGETYVHRVKYKLKRHQDNNNIAPEQNPGNAYEEEYEA